MKLEAIIRKSLERTLECKFKKTVIERNKLLGKGWACVRIKEFSNELAKEIKNHVSRR